MGSDTRGVHEKILCCVYLFSFFVTVTKSIITTAIIPMAAMGFSFKRRREEYELAPYGVLTGGRLHGL